MNSERNIPKGIKEDLYFENKMFWLGLIFTAVGLFLIISLLRHWMIFFFSIAFLTIGIYHLISTISRIKLVVSLMKKGQLGKGYITGNDEVKTYIKSHILVEYFFEFKLSDGTSVNTSCIANDYWRSINYDGEPILYDINNPKRAMIIDTLNESAKRWILRNINR